MAGVTPEYQALIVSPLTLVVVSARISLPSTTTCDQPCSAGTCKASYRSGPAEPCPANSDFWNPTSQIDYEPLPRATGPLSAPAWIGGGVNPLTMR